MNFARDRPRVKILSLLGWKPVWKRGSFGGWILAGAFVFVGEGLMGGGSFVLACTAYGVESLLFVGILRVDHLIFVLRRIFTLNYFIFA